MHEKGFIHRNINLTNISIGHDDKQNILYLNDFKESKKYFFKNKHIINKHGITYDSRNTTFMS